MNPAVSPVNPMTTAGNPMNSAMNPAMNTGLNPSMSASINAVNTMNAMSNMNNLNMSTTSAINTNQISAMNAANTVNNAMRTTINSIQLMTFFTNQINRVRMQPATLILHLQARKFTSQFEYAHSLLPNVRYKVKQGQTAVNDAIKYLQTKMPTAALTLSEHLCEAAYQVGLDLIKLTRNQLGSITNAMGTGINNMQNTNMNMNVNTSMNMTGSMNSAQNINMNPNLNTSVNSNMSAGMNQNMNPALGVNQNMSGSMGYANPNAGLNYLEKVDRQLAKMKLLQCGDTEMIVQYGFRQDPEIVPSIIVDDGEPTRIHRTLLMGQQMRYLGLSVHEHPQYDYMLIILLNRNIRAQPPGCQCSIF